MKFAKLLFLFFCISISGLRAQVAEKIFITTDKQWYYPGEKIWFNVHVLDACTNVADSLSSSATATLIDPKSGFVREIAFAIRGGNGNANFVVSNIFPTGRYILGCAVASSSSSEIASIPVYITIVNPYLPGTLPNNVEGIDESNLDGSEVVQVKTSKTILGQREKFSIDLISSEASEITISVYRLDSLQTGRCNHSPDLLKKLCGSERNSRDFVGSGTDGTLFAARIVEKSSRKPGAGIRAYLSIAGAPHLLYSATSDQNGRVMFNVPSLKGSSTLILQTNPLVDSNFIVVRELISEAGISSSNDNGNWDVFQAHPLTVDKSMIASQVQNTFNDEVESIAAPVYSDTTPFYGKPVARYQISDYVSFTTVEEILREYVTTVGVQKRQGKQVPFIVDGLMRKPFPGPPLILLNGVPEFDIDRFLQINPKEINSIQVLNRKYFMGYDVFYGIVDVRLQSPDPHIHPNASVMEYTNIGLGKEYQRKLYESAAAVETRKPDFRTLLYWAPNIQLSPGKQRSMDVFTSDIQGDYAIVVHSLSGERGPACNKIFIEVK